MKTQEEQCIERTLMALERIAVTAEVERQWYGARFVADVENGIWGAPEAYAFASMVHDFKHDLAACVRQANRSPLNRYRLPD